MHNILDQDLVKKLGWKLESITPLSITVADET